MFDQRKKFQRHCNWIVASFIAIFENIVRIVTLGFYHPGWEMDYLVYGAKYTNKLTQKEKVTP